MVRCPENNFFVNKKKLITIELVDLGFIKQEINSMAKDGIIQLKFFLSVVNTLRGILQLPLFKYFLNI